MNLGETICRLRTQAGLSQSDLADALEVSRQSVSKWETNASVPDLDKLIRMSEFFRVSLDELVKGSGEPETPPAEPCPAAAPESVTASELAEPAPRRTRARSVGIGLLCAAAVAAVVCVALFGVFGILFALPLLVPGLVCVAARRHPALKALWAEFFLIDAYMCWATGIRASQVFLTLLWTPQNELCASCVRVGAVCVRDRACARHGTDALPETRPADESGKTDGRAGRRTVSGAALSPSAGCSCSGPRSGCTRTSV